jgi:hypothetical protein
MLDKGLTWKKQLVKVTIKAYRAFWTWKGTFGNTLRPKPKVMYWIYIMVVQPTVTYAALCGGLGSNSKEARVNLANCRRWPAWTLLEQWKQLQQLQLRSSMDSPHCTCNWRLRPEQEFIDSTAEINGNPIL